MLTGGGNVDFAIVAVEGRLHYVDLDYQFTNASVAPTPEPTTLFLITGGLASAYALRRRRNPMA